MSQTGKTRGRERAIEALLSTSTITEAAEKAGISKRTMLRWMKEAEFRDAYLDAKADMLRTATGILTRKAGRAAEVLAEIFDNKGEPHQGARVSAAQATISLSLSAFELESLEQRIRKLEAQSHEST